MVRITVSLLLILLAAAPAAFSPHDAQAQAGVVEGERLLAHRGVELLLVLGEAAGVVHPDLVALLGFLTGPDDHVAEAGGVGLLAVWASLGPQAGLYSLLYQLIPVFSFLRAPGRMGIVVMLSLAVIAGFGVQVGLIVELRRRQGPARPAAAAGAAGAGGSTVGMIACCAHHLAELAPFVAVTGAATFLVTYRLAFMAVGLAATAAGITVALRRLRHLSAAPDQEEAFACAAH
jgi:hypothetical protein